MSRQKHLARRRAHRKRGSSVPPPCGVTRRDLLKGAVMGGLATAVGGGLLSASGAGADPASPANAPNILFVFSDSQRASAWSGGSESHVITPNLQRLADRGVVFTQCVANYPLCSPARASLLTGLFPQTHGVTDNVPNYCSTPLDTRFTTVAEVCRDAGYATGYVGRWHLDTTKLKEDIPPGPARQGFDDYWRHIRILYARGYKTWTFDTDGHPTPLDPWSVPAQTDMAIEGIHKLKDRPFCLFVSFTPPHSPYDKAPEALRRLYRDIDFPLRPNVSRPGDFTKEQLRGYYAFITGIDAAVGRLTGALEAMGLAENTIVVYTSDHGELINSHDHWTKYFPWEESIGVPLILRWPHGLTGNRRMQLPVGTVDLAPTLLGLAGLPIPRAMEGRNLAPALRGQRAVDGEDSVFLMRILPPGLKDDFGSGDWRGLRDARYTYARRRDGNASEPWLLYDNVADPFQMDNLARDGRHRELRRRLDRELKRWVRRTGDPFPVKG